MIKHILFDADGVLIHSEMFSRQIEREYGIPRDKLTEFYQGPFPQTIAGKADLKEIIESYLKKWNWPKTVDDYLQEWFEYEHNLDERIVEYVQRLRAKGIHCYVATNQEKYRAQYMIEKMGFKDSFDKLFASAHLGSQKPDLEFFDKVLKEIDAQKDEVLFWDDSHENVAGAKAFGIHAEFFESFEKFKTIMKDRYEISV